MPTSTVENYLKHIYLQQHHFHNDLMPTGRLAQVMNVTPGTATSMVKTLADAALIDYEPRCGVRLTEAGQKLALRVLRRHRLIELFLVKTLKFDWSQVHDEAEELEHVISNRMLERIDEHLGHPTKDPHGDPIPSAAGTVHAIERHSLSDCVIGQPMRVMRVMDQQPSFLRFVDSHGLNPGVGLIVHERDEAADSVTIESVDGEHITLGTAAADKILVEAV